jgi:hypothetical protein
MFVYGAAQLVKLSDSWPKFKFFDFHKMLNNLLEGQKFPGYRKYTFYDNWDGPVVSTGQETERCWKQQFGKVNNSGIVCLLFLR